MDKKKIKQIVGALIGILITIAGFLGMQNKDGVLDLGEIKVTTETKAPVESVKPAVVTTASVKVVKPTT